MNLNDLAFVVNYILTSASQEKLSELYSQLVTLINQAISSPTEEVSEQITDKRDELIGAHKNINTAGWSYGRQQIFIQLGAAEVVGAGGAGTLLGNFDGYSTSQELLKKVQSSSTEVQQFIESMSKLKASLGSAGEYKEEEGIEGKVLVEIVFDGDVSIKTISELAAQSKEWELVISNYQRLVGNTEGSVEIAYLNKINPTILGIEVFPILAHIFKWTVEPILDVRNKWLEGQILLEKLKGLKMDNLIKKNTTKAQDELRDKTVKQITDKIMKEFGKKLPEGTSQEEVSNFVKHNTEEIFDFIVKGGRIDVAAEADGDFKASFQLSDSYVKMKQLETDVQKFLEAPKKEEPVAEPEEAEEEAAEEEPEA